MFLISSFLAKSNDVSPTQLLVFLLAPLETTYLTMLVLPKYEAKCNGVHSSLSFALTFAPLEIRYSTIGR